MQGEAGRQVPRAIALASAIAVALAPAGAAAQSSTAQSKEAERLFVQGEKLLAAGKTAEACAAFEQSNALEARAGTLINIGSCKENVGQLASALEALRAALARVKDPKKKKIATQRAAALEPRVSTLTVSVADGAMVPGLVVKRDGQVVDEASFGTPVPIDGGSYAIAATAPGHEAWFTTVRIPAERGQVLVAVPPLAARREAPPPPPPSRWARLSSRRKAALVLGVAGLGILGAGAGFGLSSVRNENEAFDLCPVPEQACADAARATEALDRSHTHALVANIAYAAGGAALVGAVVLWLRGKPAAEPSRVTVSPRAGGPGVSVQVRF